MLHTNDSRRLNSVTKRKKWVTLSKWWEQQVERREQSYGPPFLCANAKPFVFLTLPWTQLECGPQVATLGRDIYNMLAQALVT
jgi:hypothetical protein